MTDVTKPILTITAADPTGESGVQADVNTMSALGCHAVTAVTSITVQTTLGIQEFFDLPAEIVAGQIEAVMNDVQPQVVKVGLIRTREVLDVVIDVLRRYRPRHIVYDPVVRSSRGELLISKTVVRGINEQLLPLCTLVIDRKHYLGNDTKAFHGLSNAFASAVAVYLNQGDAEEVALEKAQTFVRTQVVRFSGLQGRSAELYNEFLSAVDAHIQTNNDVAFYADRLNVSPRYLAQVCRRMAQKSPKAIIDDWLTSQIEIRLTTTTLTIQEIAYALGFSSQAHFTKFFKKQRGITPSAFRAKR
ncbi:MAG: bifunctional hydroxymethylpyrimidine kinase/phosphomethylpyrimidine kinase [Prevotella sp.]|nr:bifunctional hydroxymethylpyrimidine kinase/phosphomethylpyrimidine kinase [Prevotella sp.]